MKICLLAIGLLMVGSVQAQLRVRENLKQAGQVSADSKSRSQKLESKGRSVADEKRVNGNSSAR
jgi:hypothetical protein